MIDVADCRTATDWDWVLFYQTGAVSVYKMVNNETWDTGLVTCRDITLMCVRRHGTARQGDTRQGDTERGRHVCVRSLDSWTASDNNLSFCLCDWSTRDTRETRDLHCPPLFLAQTFLHKLQSGGGDLTYQNVRGEGGGQILSCWTKTWRTSIVLTLEVPPSTAHLEGGRYKGTKAFQEPWPVWLLNYQTGAGRLPLNYFLNPHRKRLDKGLLSNLTQQVGRVDICSSSSVDTGRDYYQTFQVLFCFRMVPFSPEWGLVAALFTSFSLTMSWPEQTTNSISSVPAKSNN